MTGSNSEFNSYLTAADERALEALSAAGFDPARLAPDLSEADRARALRAASLLGLLGTPVSSEGKNATDGRLGSLIDATMARVLRAGPIPGLNAEPMAGDDAGFDDVELHPEDAEALDAYVNAGFRLHKVPSDLRARAERIDAFGRMVMMPSEASSRLTDGINGTSLIERTMAKVQATPRPARSLDAGSPRSGGLRLADIASMAALFVLAVGLLFPVASAMKSSSRMTACMSGLGDVASALTRYAADFRGELPLAKSPFKGPTWWNVGEAGRSNSANIFTLAREQYATLDPLACRGNSAAPHGKAEAHSEDWANFDQVSYSYQVMAGKHRPHWDRADAGVVVLADRSPIVRRALAGTAIYPLENSANHGGRGQNVLRADGSAAFMTTPMNGSDNIWLPGSVEVKLQIGRELLNGRNGFIGIPITGTEVPASRSDSFLGP